jgi:hypothetical protein
VPAAIATKITIDRSIIAHRGLPVQSRLPRRPDRNDCRARKLNPHQPQSSTAGAPSHPLIFLSFFIRLIGARLPTRGRTVFGRSHDLASN